jgi:hypothetical protein
LLEKAAFADLKADAGEDLEWAITASNCSREQRHPFRARDSAIGWHFVPHRGFLKVIMRHVYVANFLESSRKLAY